MNATSDATSDTVRRRLDELLGPRQDVGGEQGRPQRRGAPLSQARPAAADEGALDVPLAVAPDGLWGSDDDQILGGDQREGRPGVGSLPGLGSTSTATRPTARAVFVRAWSLAREHVVAIAVVALCGCAWTVFQLMSARPQPLQPSVATPAAPVVRTATASATPTPSLQVHVAGAVVKPGVVTLPPGARVHQAISAAGGTAKDASVGELNLAAPLHDGEQVLVGRSDGPASALRGSDGGASGTAAGAGAGGAGAGGAVPGGKVNLNTATVVQLDALPGVGPVTAQSILAWREQHGRFSRVEELQEIDGIGPKTFEKLAPLVSV